MLDAPIVRLILAYHLTCSRWKCSWGEGTHWKASGTYVKSKKHTSPNWIVMGNLVPGQSRIGPLMQRNIHWWHVPSSSSTQASQSASTCPTSWLGRPGLQPGPEMPMAAMALKPGSYIYIYIERSVEMAKPDMPGCHAWFSAWTEYQNGHPNSSTVWVFMHLSGTPPWPCLNTDTIAWLRHGEHVHYTDLGKPLQSLEVGQLG